jgi:hypothetical protein
VSQQGAAGIPTRYEPGLQGIHLIPRRLNARSLVLRDEVENDYLRFGQRVSIS